MLNSFKPLRLSGKGLWSGLYVERSPKLLTSDQRRNLEIDDDNFPLH